MDLRMLSAGQVGILKGVVGTTLVFATGIAVGLFFLKRKHEDELDKLEKDTAMTCLDFAADHYEGVIRRQKKAAGKAASTPAQSANTPYYEEFLAFQQSLDRAGKHEPTEEEWAEIGRQLEAEKRVAEIEKQHVEEQSARLDLELDRVKLKMLAEKAAELAEKAQAARPPETHDPDSEEFQREIDAMNNYEDPED